MPKKRVALFYLPRPQHFYGIDKIANAGNKEKLGQEGSHHESLGDAVMLTR
jgi:hypothetical protein